MAPPRSVFPRLMVAGRLLSAGYAVLAAAVAGYALTFPSAVPSTAVAHALGIFTATVAGAVCLGGVVLILITARPDDRGVIDAPAFRVHRVVERVSVVWFVTALAMVVIQVAADAGLSLPLLFSSDRIGSIGNAVGASAYARAWVMVAICAAVTAVDSGDHRRGGIPGYRQCQLRARP